MIKKFYKILVLLFFCQTYFCKIRIFEEGISLYKKNKFEDAKFKFEQDIVFNPKVNYHIYTYQKFSTNKKKKF